MYKKDYTLNPVTCFCENGRYLANIIENSAITYDGIIDAEETKTIPINIICETKSFYILLAFLLIIIVLFIAFSIYSCLIECKAKQKNLLPYYVTNDELINK